MKNQICLLVACIFVVATLVSCSSTQPKIKDDSLPTSANEDYVTRPHFLNIYIGGFLGPSYEIISDGLTIRYKAVNSIEEVFTPDEKTWKKFRESLNKVNAWGWNSKYIDPKIKDGTTWGVIIVDENGKQIHTYGRNAYPNKFNDFLAAVRELVGGREFQ